MIKVAVCGAAEGAEFCGALERPGHPQIGEDAGLLAGCGRTDVLITDNLNAVVASCDVLIDFTSPKVSLKKMELCALHKKSIVNGTTGFTPEKRDFARILSELLEAAASSAVEVGPISYKPVPIKEEALLSYQLSLSVSGRYAAVKSYLSDLQNSPELIVVDTVSFSNSDLFVEKVVMDLRITVYLREGA